MNEIVNKFLLAGDKFMPEMHLKQPGLTYSVCGPFIKNKERIQNFKETGDTNYIYKNELDRACFQHDIAYGDFKDLKRRTFSDKALRDKAFNIAKNPKYDGYQRRLASMVYKFFDKKSTGSGITNEPNYQLANELHKSIIRTFKKRKVYSFFRDNIWGVDLADMHSLSKYNKGNKYLLCAIDLFSKYAWVLPIKDKKGTSIVNAFKKIISEGRKPNKIWFDQGIESYNNSFKDFLKINNIEIYSTHNEGKSVVAERFIRTLKNKIFKCITAISKNVYFDVLDDIVDKYNNTVYRSIKMEPTDIEDNTYIDFKKEVNDKDPKFKVGDHVKISTYKNIFAKEYMTNWSEKVFLVSKIKNTVPWAYVIMILIVKKLLEHFMKKNYKRLIKKNLE